MTTEDFKKLKAPPNCPYILEDEDGDLIHLFLDTPSNKIKDIGRYGQKILACIALRYWEMEYHSTDSTDEILTAKGQLHLWNEFGDF